MQTQEIDGSCEYFEKAVMYSQQRVVLENEGWDGGLKFPP